MFDLDGLEAGPFDDAPLPFGPRVMVDGLFTRHVDALVGTLGGSDGALQSSASTAGDNVPHDLDVAFLTTVGYAAQAHAEEVRGGSQSIAGALVGDGEDVETLRQSVLRYLPAPDAPIGAGLDPPPDPAVIRTGRGLDEAPPPPPEQSTDTAP